MMKKMKMAAASAAAIAIATGFCGSAMAQSTTADIRGSVTDASGAPVSGAAVTVTDALTGTTRSVRTGSNGGYSVRGLNVTGDYAVSVDTDRFADETVSGVRLSLGDTTVVNFDLEGSSTDDEIVVVATRSSAMEIATGPAATFDFADLQNAPAVNRDIKDIIRQDPRLFIEESNRDGLQCAGASPRFNSLTVDGIRLNDNFGLNDNGYPTERLPFPYDAINQVAVELAPFDVEYGGFTGCNINAVTRSGENEFHGGAWFDWTSDALRGGSIDGDSFDKGDFSNFRFGANVSGPIIKDKLFFFAAYEKINETEVFGRGPAELGATGVQGVTQAQLDRIFQIARDVYNYDPTLLPSSAPEDDEKILVKLDWNINDNHRAAFTYNRVTGFNQTASDSDPDEYESFDHYYLRSTKLTNYSGQIFSSWTDRFSTELRVSYTKNDTDQVSNDTTSFGEVQIRTYNPVTDQSAVVYIGGDDSRQANDLNTETFNVKFKADYHVNNHLLSFGYERETVDVFNLFIQHTQGEYRFDRVSGSNLELDPDANIDDFLIGLADDIYYGNAGGTNNPDDGAANFSFTTNTIYAQDEMNFGRLDITAGVRFDWYSSGDTPQENPNFVARNGFSNTHTFDGKSLIQPRLGFNYEAMDNLTIRGGAGIFSGGNPNVWLSNSYQNDGQTVVQVSQRDVDMTGLTFVQGDAGNESTPIWGVPQNLVTDVINGTSNTGVNAVDPDFEIPSQWKAAIGATYDFWDQTTLLVDFIYTRDRKAAGIIDATLEQVATAPDGRPIYRNIDRADPDCANPLSSDCDDRAFNSDYILTNNEGGEQKVFSIALSKELDFDSGLRANWGVAYAFTDAKDRNPMTSAVAFSNYALFTSSDPNNPALANSNYEVPHRFTVRGSIAYPFFGEHETRLTLFGQISQSRPYSFVFGGSDGDVFGDTVNGRHLLYVPTDASDPNVVFNPGFDTAAFFGMLDNLGLNQYAGGIAPRNAFQSEWYSQWDVRFEQEIPGLFSGHRGSAFVVIDNIGNLLNDKWGVISQAGFPGSFELVELDDTENSAGIAGLNDAGQYVFDSFTDIAGREEIFSPVTRASVWQIRMGVRYEF